MTDYREFQDGEVVPGTRYRVTRLIGSGGMGRVYEVEHQELGKRFVLKALLRELSRREDLVARLRNEWRALARLEHPNIVTVTDAGTSENGVPFYVMERLEGETLAALLHRERRLHPQRALGIAASILQGLHAAHRIGVVHRDVKPPNIFVTASGAVKVLDFGIAKIKDAKGVITARGIAVGTPRYMSPEQAQGSPVDARSDIYATALMLFEMVSGLGPFDDAKDNNELLLAHLGRPAPLLSSICVVAPELDALVAGMLAKDPRERPGNAQQVAETLLSLGDRYAHFVATDAPTVNVTPRPHGSVELPTRQDIRRAPAIGAPTRPDAPAAFSRSGPSSDPHTTTLRPALESATTIADVLPAAGAGGTVRITPAPPLSPASLYGPDTLMDSVTGAPTGIPAPVTVHTETLLTPPVLPGQRAAAEAVPTRTAVPLAEPNLTPPPVVPSPASVRSVGAPSSRRSLVVAVVAVAAVGGLAVAAFGWRGSATSARLAAAGEGRPVPSAVDPAPPLVGAVSAPVPPPVVSAAAPTSSPPSDEAGARPVAPKEPATAGRPAVASAGIGSKKGAFLGAVPKPSEPPASSTRPAPAPAKARASVGMPGSGL